MTRDALVGDSYPVGARPSSAGTAAIATAVAYSALGLTLVATRLLGLDRSFWHDEITAVADYVRAGPRQILAGPDLSHELFGLLAWSTGHAFGESEIAFRLWSVVPFLLGAVIVTAWLHARVSSMSGLLFLYFTTVSPLLLDIARQARGYGLAFLAMSILVVAGLEGSRTGRGWTVVAFSVAGIVGTWTLPQFGIPFLATGLVLLTNAALRPRMALGLGASVLAIVAWYAPHLGEIRDAAHIEDGIQIRTLWLLTAPFDQILIPALLWIDGTVLVPGVLWLPLVLVAAVLIGSSPLLRERGGALVLCAGTVASVLTLWGVQAYVIPRYLSFLLVPLFVLLATGMARVFAGLGRSPMFARTIVSFVVLAALAIRFVTLAPDVVRLPREAHRDAAAIVERSLPAGAPVLAYLHNPTDLAFYLGRPVRALDRSDVVSSVCGNRVTVAYVMQPFAIRPVDVPCLNRAGTTHYRFRQYTRGEMNVWFVPPGPGP